MRYALWNRTLLPERNIRRVRDAFTFVGGPVFKPILEQYAMKKACELTLKKYSFLSSFRESNHKFIEKMIWIQKRLKQTINTNRAKFNRM